MRLRSDRRVEKKFFRCYARGEDLGNDADRCLEVRVLERRDIEELHEEQVQKARLQTRPEHNDVHAHSQQRVRGLHLHAVDQKAVAQRCIGVMDYRARAQQVRGDGNGQGFDVHVRGDGEGRDVVEGGEQVRVGRVCKDGERGDIVNYVGG